MTRSTVDGSRDVVAHLNFALATAMAGKLTSAQLAVAAAIADAHRTNGVARFTYAELAACAVCSRRNAIRCVTRLVRDGLISVKPAGNGNEYHPNLDFGSRHDAAWRSWNAVWRKGGRDGFPQIV